MRISGPSCKSAPVWIVRRSPPGGILVRSWARGPTPSLRPGQPAPATAQTGMGTPGGPLMDVILGSLLVLVGVMYGRHSRGGSEIGERPMRDALPDSSDHESFDT